MFSVRKPTPGTPSLCTSVCCFSEISRLSQTKPRFDDEPVAQIGVIEIGDDGGEQFARLVRIDNAARFGEQRRRHHVARQHFAVAIENVGPRGRHGVARDAAMRGLGVRRDRVEHETTSDDEIDHRKRRNRETEPRLRLLAAIDIAAIEHRLRDPAMPGLFDRSFGLHR